MMAMTFAMLSTMASASRLPAAVHVPFGTLRARTSSARSSRATSLMACPHATTHAGGLAFTML